MILYKIIRVLLFPFIYWFMPMIFPFLKKRIEFEAQNKFLNISGGNAEIAFQISSVGELEQVYTLIKMFVTDGACVEICFTSPSVENGCKRLQQDFPNQIRLFRYPLLSYLPWSHRNNPAYFLTASTICLVRYDFFPEVIELGKERSLILFAATSKSFKGSNFFKKIYYRWCYSHFAFFYTSLKSDYSALKKMGYSKISHLDWRIKRIQDRITIFEDTLLEKFSGYHFFKVLLSQYDKENRLILGSAWENDLSLLATDLKDKLVLIVPHDLKTSFGKNENYYHLNNHMNGEDWQNFLLLFKKNPRPIVLNISGILCELYSLCSHAYVGGGFGKSVHSLFEPFFSGCHVYCGPHVQRSTEYDFILQSNPNSKLIVSELSLKTLKQEANQVSLPSIDWEAEYKKFKSLCR